MQNVSMQRFEYLFSKETLKKTGMPESFYCLLANILEAFKEENISVFLEKISSSSKYANLLIFFQKLDADLTLQHYVEENLSGDYRISKSCFVETYELGVLCLWDLSSLKFSLAGSSAKSKNLRPIKEYVQKRYFEERERNSNIKANAIARIVAQEVLEKFPNTSLSKANINGCLNKWLSQIKKKGSIV